jgi:glycosyltransferase involved in cell wall biosynthesis
VDVRPIQWPGSNPLRAIVQLARIIRVVGYDIVNVQRGHDILQSWAAARLSWRRPVLVYTVQVPRFVRSRFLLGRMDKIVAVSRYIEEKLVSYVPSLSPRVSVSHYGIDLSRFTPTRRERGALRRRFGLPAEAPIIGTVGDLWKNQIEFLDALAEVRMAVPNVRYALAAAESGLAEIDRFKKGAALLLAGGLPFRAAGRGRRRIRLGGALPPGGMGGFHRGPRRQRSRLWAEPGGRITLVVAHGLQIDPKSHSWGRRRAGIVLKLVRYSGVASPTRHRAKGQDDATGQDDARSGWRGYAVGTTGDYLHRQAGSGWGSLVASRWGLTKTIARGSRSSTASREGAASAEVMVYRSIKGFKEMPLRRLTARAAGVGTTGAFLPRCSASWLGVHCLESLGE